MEIPDYPNDEIAFKEGTRKMQCRFRGDYVFCVFVDKNDNREFIRAFEITPIQFKPLESFENEFKLLRDEMIKDIGEDF